MSNWRKRLPWIIFIAASIFCLTSCWNYYRASAASANQAADGLLECQRLLEELNRNRNAPRIASLAVESPDRIADRIASAAQNADLPAYAILSIDPQAPARLGRSAYQVRATQIVLQDAQLWQVAGFVQGLEEPQSGMLVRDLAINRGRSEGAAGQELWNVRLTLTQMIFSPISEL